MAYTTATIPEGGASVNADGSVTAVVTYTGDAGETPVQFAYTVNSLGQAAGTWLRGQAMDRIAILNSNKTVLSSLVLPKVLDTTTPIPGPPASTFGSYLAATPFFTPVATAQDVCGIVGVAGKTVTVTGLWLTTVQTTAGSNIWQVLKRSSLNMGGTATTVAAVPTDSAYPAAAAAVRFYTVNPTLSGTLVGAVWVGRVAAPAPASAALSPFATSLLPSDRRPIVLNTANDLLAVNFNGQVVPAGLSAQVVVSWNEAS